MAAPLSARGQGDLARTPTLTVGERLTYDVKFGPIRVGGASMEVLGVEEVRGRRAWHTRFQVTGGTLFFRVNDILESWIDVETFSSLRFRQQLAEGPRDRLYEYEIFPERATFVPKGKPERPSVEHPLDDGSFLYFLRTVPLELGGTRFSPYVNKVDARFTKIFRFGTRRISGSLDVFNVFNSAGVVQLNTVFGPNYLNATQITGARYFRFSAQFDF